MLRLRPQHDTSKLSGYLRRSVLVENILAKEQRILEILGEIKQVLAGRAQ